MAHYVDFALADGDIQLDEAGNLVRIYCQDVVVQRVQVRLRTHLGEWPWDVTFGTDYRGRILGKGVDVHVAAAELVRVVAETSGVTRVTSYEIDFNRATRVLSVTIQAETEECAFQVQLDAGEDGSLDLLATVLGLLSTIY